MSKIIFIGIVALGVGFFSGRFTAKPEVKEPVQCIDLKSAKEDLVSISENEYKEYTQIKDLKQKYEKADELLGRIMLLFLADLGFKAEKGVVNEPVTNAAQPPAAALPSAPVETVQAAPAQTKPIAQQESPLIGASKSIKNVNSDKQVREILDKAVVENPKLELAKGAEPTRRQTRLLEGRYSGTVRFLDGKRQDLSITWDLVPERRRNGLSGTFSLSIHGQGMSSDTNGRGQIDNIVSLAEDKEGFLVSACGGGCYLQLYYNYPSDRFFGNYYEQPKNSNAGFARIGLIELKK